MKQLIKDLIYFLKIRKELNKKIIRPNFFSKDTGLNISQNEDQLDNLDYKQFIDGQTLNDIKDLNLWLKLTQDSALMAVNLLNEVKKIDINYYNDLYDKTIEEKSLINSEDCSFLGFRESYILKDLFLKSDTDYSLRYGEKNKKIFIDPIFKSLFKYLDLNKSSDAESEILQKITSGGAIKIKGIKNFLLFKSLQSICTYYLNAKGFYLEAKNEKSSFEYSTNDLINFNSSAIFYGKSCKKILEVLDSDVSDEIKMAFTDLFKNYDSSWRPACEHVSLFKDYDNIKKLAIDLDVPVWAIDDENGIPNDVWLDYSVYDKLRLCKGLPWGVENEKLKDFVVDYIKKEQDLFRTEKIQSHACDNYRQREKELDFIRKKEMELDLSIEVADFLIRSKLPKESSWKYNGCFKFNKKLNLNIKDLDLNLENHLMKEVLKSLNLKEMELNYRAENLNDLALKIESEKEKLDFKVLIPIPSTDYSPRLKARGSFCKRV